jgi:S-sulfo-L-cysteine synthase (3-phospho-L-serine-dependent)
VTTSMAHSARSSSDAWRGRRVLALGASTQPRTPTYLGDAAAALGLHTTVFHDPTLGAPRPPFDDVHEVDLADEAAVVGLARELHARHPFDGVTTFIESRVELLAAVGEALALPAPSRRTAHVCRSKLAMRRVLAQAGIPVPRFGEVRTEEELPRVLADVGFPCVLKPVAAWGSVGVVRLEGHEDSHQAWALASAAAAQETGQVARFLVEEYVEGPEFSCEGVIDTDGLHVAGLTQKLTTDLPYFEERQHVFPATFAPAQRDVLVDAVRAALQALGITCGGFHAELRLTPAGPRFMEVAARLGGDAIPTLVRLATGQDLPASALVASLGGSLPLRSTRQRFAGIRFFFPPRAGVLRRAELGIDPRRVAGLVGFHNTAVPGSVLRLPPHAYGTRPLWAIAVHRESAGLMEIFDGLERHIEWDIDPS